MRLVIEVADVWQPDIARYSQGTARLEVGGFFGRAVNARILGVLPDETDAQLCVIPLDKMPS